MATYAEIDENGSLVNICGNTPETRNTTRTVVKLKYMPEYDQVHPDGIWEPVPLKYDPETETAVLDEDAWNREKEVERKNEILSLIRKKKDIAEAEEAYGIDYSTELAEVDARLLELTT